MSRLSVKEIHLLISYLEACVGGASTVETLQRQRHWKVPFLYPERKHSLSTLLVQVGTCEHVGMAPSCCLVKTGVGEQ